MATLFITGGNRGIGLAILKRFAAEGYNIIVSTRKQYPEFESECREIESTQGVMIHHAYMELDNPDSIAQGLKNIDALGIVPDVVVNNAGIFHEKMLLFSKMEDIKKVFQVNYFSVLQITQHFAKAMMRMGGVIINISSVAADNNQPSATAYGASKAALNRFTKSLAQELAAFKIRVNAVAIGVADTEIINNLSDKSQANIKESIAMKRMADPIEIANTVYFLANDQSSYVDGQILRVDGGLRI
jgi:3-oxoacyl-[acyl-carrier protein] reductase